MGLINWWIVGGAAVGGAIGGFLVACRLFFAMQQDFVNLIGGSPKGK